MLEQVLRAMNNWFVRETHNGEFTIADGRLALPFLQNGQYFVIAGSVFNDGLHQYPAENLINETFKGCIAALAVPQAVISLSEKANVWNENNGAQTAGAYQSESFGGYSYSRATGKDGKPLTWQDVFANELSQWRKI